MASRTKLLTDLSLADPWKEVKDSFRGDLSGEAERALRPDGLDRTTLPGHRETGSNSGATGAETVCVLFVRW